MQNGELLQKYMIHTEEGIQSELYEKIVQLKLIASDGKKYATDCANTETTLRIIQSIPSPIGQWIMIDWQCSINPKSWFIPKEQIESGFKAYLKKWK